MADQTDARSNVRYRLVFGAVGSILPLFLFLATTDGKAISDKLLNMPTPEYIGHALKGVGLVVCGLIAAGIYETEKNAWRLMLIGAAAPALLNSILQDIRQQKLLNEFSVTRTAHAQSKPSTFFRANVQQIDCLSTPSVTARILDAFLASKVSEGSGNIYLFMNVEVKAKTDTEWNEVAELVKTSFQLALRSSQQQIHFYLGARREWRGEIYYLSTFALLPSPQSKLLWNQMIAAGREHFELSNGVLVYIRRPNDQFQSQRRSNMGYKEAIHLVDWSYVTEYARNVGIPRCQDQ